MERGLFLFIYAFYIASNFNDINYYTINYHPLSLNLDAVGLLACFNDPESYVGGSLLLAGFT